MTHNVKPSQSKRRPTRNYFSRREQWRLLALVMGLGLVVVMMREAAREETWYWLTGRQPSLDAPDSKPQPDYDTSYQPTPPPERSDAVRIINDEFPAAGPEDGYFPGVVPGYLARVEDNRTHQHPEEAAAWFNLWQVLQANEDQFIDPESTGPVTFGELFEQPEIFRGKLVTIEGTVQRAEYVTAAKKNRAKIEGYYRLILRLRGGVNRPVFLYALHLPEKFPLGDNLSAPISATAFFYKNWLYSGEQGHSWIAPVLLCKSVRWEPKPVVNQKIDDTTAIALTLALALISIFIAWWLMKRSNRVPHATDKVRFNITTPPEIDPEEVEQTAREHLRDLASREAPSDP
ncbi:MAG: hypothetical protein VX431_01935 [Planctomycetota bacterium]|nr:hypothetical protein [Planctomycetota bacterium]